MSTDSSKESDGDFSSNSDTDAIICGGTESGSGSSLISDPNIASSSSTSSDDDLVIVSGAFSSMVKQNDDRQEIRIFNVDFRALTSCGNTSKEGEEKGLESNEKLQSSCADTSESFYHVSASDFMDVVQKLTGSSSSIEKRVCSAVSVSVDPMDIQPLHRKRPLPLSLPRPGFGKKLYEEHVGVMKKVKTEDRVPTEAAAPVSPPGFTATWNSENMESIFEAPPLSPLSPSDFTATWDSADTKGIFELPPLSPLSPLEFASYFPSQSDMI